ncbi:MAG TPA: ComF family protein [Thermoanaerobaculia bacterium]|nr:ComF family protein [Thermoanaerobaculia bacterium]
MGPRRPSLLYVPRAERVTTPAPTAARRWAPLARWAADLLAPPACPGCRRHLAVPGPGLGLCLGCRSRVVAHDGRRCRGCARALAGPTRPADGRCGDCRRRPPPWSSLFCLWDYAPPVDRVLHVFKFERLEGLGGCFAREGWDRWGEELAAADGVVAMPLPWTRRLLRGFNQAEAIARPLARRLGRPLLDPLARSPSPPMSRMSAAARRRLARRTLHLRAGVALPRSVLLVDDVVTTGATLRAATRLLWSAGAREVLALAPFWTPAPGGLRARPENP